MTGQAMAATARRRLRILRRPTESIRPAMPRPQRRDCQGRLVAALLALAGDDTSLDAASLRPWRSATFIGAQHRLTLRLSGPDALARVDRLANGLPEAELSLPGHIVADLVVDAIRTLDDGIVLIDLAALTIEDW